MPRRARQGLRLALRVDVGQMAAQLDHTFPPERHDWCGARNYALTSQGCLSAAKTHELFQRKGLMLYIQCVHAKPNGPHESNELVCSRVLVEMERLMR